MKKTALCLALLGLLALGGQALALICTIDDVPAATLLLPYFEVDLGNPNGVNTLFSINNASATAVLAHVVVWGDLSVPVLDFNIYLTGYDVQTINLRDIFVGGILPRTASAGQDPGDTISPHGSFSQDINFASCTGQLPPPVLPASFVTGLQNSLRGLASSNLGGRCAGQALGDNVARGYITVDTVNNCTLRFPGDPGYFGAGGTGDVTNQNVLWGDYFYVNTGENFAQGETLVHIEAAPGTGVNAVQGNYGANPQTTTPGQYTFYGRYVGWNATDNREPLATNFAGRFVNGGAFNGGTSFLCWRDSKSFSLNPAANITPAPFACPALAGSRPVWYPLGQEAVVIFDEQENPDVPTTFPVSPQPPLTPNILCPAEANRTRIGSAAFPVPFNFGWIYADLNTSVAAAGANPPEDPTAAQGWITVVMDALGRFSVGFDAVQLDSACQANHDDPGPNQ
jgi:hypothetical protein